MIIALYGASGVGKTTLARLLRRSLDLPLRCCGEMVRESATFHRIPPDRLSDEQHRWIDDATVAWVRRQSVAGGGLVEGRFLDQVLAPIASVVQFIEVRASLEARAARRAGRFVQRCGESAMLWQDEQDAAFRARLYKPPLAIQPSLVIDSTARTPEECVAWLNSYLTL